MKELITKKIEVIKELLNFKQVEEKIDIPKKVSTDIDAPRKRKGCRCHG